MRLVIRVALSLILLSFAMAPVTGHVQQAHGSEIASSQLSNLRGDYFTALDQWHSGRRDLITALRSADADSRNPILDDLLDFTEELAQRKDMVKSRDLLNIVAEFGGTQNISRVQDLCGRYDYGKVCSLVLAAIGHKSSLAKACAAVSNGRRDMSNLQQIGKRIDAFILLRSVARMEAIQCVAPILMDEAYLNDVTASKVRGCPPEERCELWFKWAQDVVDSIAQRHPELELPVADDATNYQAAFKNWWLQNKDSHSSPIDEAQGNR